MIDPHPPLIELLGAKWQFGARVVGAAWSKDGTLAGFGLGDGAVVLAKAEWDGGPEAITRTSGGVEVRPPRNPSPPVSRVSAHKHACLALVADAESGFLSSGADGRLVHIACDGTAQERATFPGHRLELIAAAKTAWCACASGRSVSILGPTRQTLRLPAEACALAFNPTGRELAIAHQDGLLIRSIEGETPARSLNCPGVPDSIAWSNDGRLLAACLRNNSLKLWLVADETEIELGEVHGQPLSLCFPSDGSFLAASGSERVQCWRFLPSGAVQPFACGLANSRAPVTVVACHPTRPLIAAGYGTGAVLLCQPGAQDVLFLKTGGGGGITALAWSPDGSRLTLATEEGDAGMLLLPDTLFRSPAQKSPDAPAAAASGIVP